MGSLDVSTVKKKLFALIGFAAGLGAVCWLLRDRLVPVPDTSPGAPPHFRGATPPPPPSPAPPPPAPPVTATPPPSETAAADDLTAIVGIGSVFAGRLADAGITTFAALAAGDPEQVAAAAGARVDQATDWIGQAARR